MTDHNNLSYQDRFDEIYADVPTEQREALRRFRLQYPPKSYEGWSYIDTQTGEQTLLLLVGGLRLADAAHANIPLLADTFRVIAPSYPPLNTMTALSDGIAAILRHEGLGKVHVLAGSFGGMLAQVFVRRHRHLVDRLVLSTTAVLDADSAQRYRQALEMIRPMPPEQVTEVAQQMMFQIIAPPDEQAAFYRAYLKELYTYRVDKAALISTYEALLDFAQNITLSSDDWNGPTLILESDDDATFDEETRSRVRALYPQAAHHVFHNAGHSPAATQRDEYFAVVKRFLNQSSV
ncbi:MAG: hypothetical protein Kow00117_10730 [Phototrophicales bacterium]